jgi:hypothetical protein
MYSIMIQQEWNYNNTDRNTYDPFVYHAIIVIISISSIASSILSRHVLPRVSCIVYSVSEIKNKKAFFILNE